MRTDVGELGALRGRGAADLAGREQHVLLLHGVGEVGHREPERLQPVGAHPDAHGVVGAAEEDDVADAGDALQLVVDVDDGVVRQEVVVEGARRAR